MADDDDDDNIVTIVDVTDPDDPRFGDMKTQRRALTAAQLSALRPMLQKVGAFQFFSKEFNFADTPAVTQFIQSVHIEEVKPTKTCKIVQDRFVGKVAGREVVIDAELIESAFGLLDDGENISKPRGDDVSGLHSFYIKPHYLDQCQTARGVNLNHVKTEFNYFKNLAHQIQAYCCGVPEEGFVKFTVYRAFDLMIRGKPVNWNRYLLQNFQERIRKYKKSPCALYFCGTLTALIYKVLKVDYQLVNKMPKEVEKAAEEVNKQAAEKEAEQSRKKSAAKPLARRRAARSPEAEDEDGSTDESEGDVDAATPDAAGPVRATRSSTRKRKAELEELGEAAGGKRRQAELEGRRGGAETGTDAGTESEPGTAEEAEELSGVQRRQALLRSGGGVDIPEVLTGHKAKSYRLSTLYNQAVGKPITKTPVQLTDSKDLWNKYAQYYALGQECHLEHIVSKRKLEETLRKVEALEGELAGKEAALAERLHAVAQLERALAEQDARLAERTAELEALRSSGTASGTGGQARCWEAAPLATSAPVGTMAVVPATPSAAPATNVSAPLTTSDAPPATLVALPATSAAPPATVATAAAEAAAKVPDAEIVEWLRGFGREEFAQKFADAGVDWKGIQFLEEEDLTSRTSNLLGVPVTVGRQIWSQVKLLRNP